MLSCPSWSCHALAFRTLAQVFLLSISLKGAMTLQKCAKDSERYPPFRYAEILAEAIKSIIPW